MSERFVQGFDDGSGMDTIRDMRAPAPVTGIGGETIATVRWGCSCCEPEQNAQHLARAKAITDALNFVQFIAEDFAIDGDVESLRVRARGILDGLPVESKSMRKRLAVQRNKSQEQFTDLYKRRV